ncbi:sensor histidine kinase [Nocardia mexicana]|uniref:histidine kinase n=1 Tax=Nocardia mexicana TaxID=279262 RepID=A0A370H3G8_9NOCA|nr:histidine kinase [Nocardia mexicana]RDI50713.1 signal transduction histidine kinase [Nocardia mexicana]
MERLRRVGRSLLGGDVESGPLMRIVGAALLGVNVVFNHHSPIAVWLWVMLGAAYACWMVYAVYSRRRPRLSLAAMAVCTVVAAAACGPAPDSSALVLLCAAISVVAEHVVLRVAVIAGVFVATVAVLAGSLLLAGRTATALAAYSGILLIVLLLGLSRRQYRIRVRQTEQLLEQTRHAQHEHARAAALDERARIAREMHDVLAHSLGALSVQLEVAEALLSEKGDLDGALTRVRQSRRLAVDGLAEARGAVAALRDDVPPLPDAVRRLAETYRRDHRLDAEFRIDGAPRVVGPAATVSLLRAAREALTNAGRHAPGQPVSMTLAFLPERVRLSVRNPVQGTATGDDASGGYGLTGMRERIALVGGTLRAGPDERGWLVTAEVPE